MLPQAKIAAMSHSMRALALSILVLTGLALVACATPPPRQNLDNIGYGDALPIRLDVREIEIERAYQPPNAAPNVDHLFPLPPAAGAQLWAVDRLKAVGPTRRARFIVHEASVIEVSLERESGLAATFTIQQSERYDARLVAELQILSEDGRVEGSVTVEVEHSRTVPENATLNQRRQTWHAMTRALLDEMDRRLDETIKEALYAYLLL